MPDVGSQVIEVVLGLVFTYLVFSLVCSFLQEYVATLLSWRAEGLEAGIRNMLRGGDPSGGEADSLFEELAAHPRIKGMRPPKRLLRRSTKLPAYLSGRTFALVLLDTVAPPPGGGAGGDLGAAAAEQIGALPDGALKRQLSASLAAAEGDLQRFRREIESWFDDAMNRVSGWYRRKTQIWLLVFALLVASVGNVDTLSVVDRLWNDPVARAAVVTQAEKANSAGDTAALEEQVETLEGIEALQLPVGWTTPDQDAAEDPRAFPDSIGARKVLGILLSALALSLGAPFWFDALSKVSRLRATGKPEGRPSGSANP